MSRVALVVLTGGARSGKSSAAVRLAEARSLDCPAVVFAVFGRAGDPEMAQRIATHQAERPEAFHTLEVDTSAALTWVEDIAKAGGDDEPESEPLLVVDCLGTLLGLVMEGAWAEGASQDLGSASADAVPVGVGEEVEKRFAAVIDTLARRAGDTIVVTNEVGMGVVPEWASARLFRDVLGRANRRLIASADSAYLCVAGRLLDLAALPTAPFWPED